MGLLTRLDAALRSMVRELIVVRRRANEALRIGLENQREIQRLALRVADLEKKEDELDPRADWEKHP